MQVFLVEQNSKFNFIQSLIKTVEKKEDKIVINKKCENLKVKDKIKLINKIKSILINNNSDKIILDNRLKRDREILNLLYSNRINIFDGKDLYKKLLKKIIEKICIENSLKPEETNIAITLNNTDTWGLNLIKYCSSKFKHLSIVTNNIQYFKNLEEKLFEEKGIIVTTTNNKRKALFKSKIILNVDFPEEVLNKYVIYDNSIIINLEEKIKIKKKRFCGKIINKYNITLKEGSNIQEDLSKEKYQNFDIKDICECYIINNPDEIKNIIIS